MKMSKLLALALVLLISVGTLAGSTIAWFTDQVKSTGNTITAGNLQIDLMLDTDPAEGTEEWVSLDPEDPENGGKDIPPVFNYTYWEPGYTTVAHVKVVNEGDLALKYNLNINAVKDETATDHLADVIDVYMFESAPDRAMISGATPVGTISELMADSDGAAYGILLPAEGKGSANTTLNPEDVEIAKKGEQEVYIALKMQEEAGNEYQGLSIGGNEGITLNLKAYQYTYEKDSFDNTYDEDSAVPLANVTNLDPAKGPRNIALYSLDPFGKTGETVEDLDVYYVFETTESAEDAVNSPYAKWHADFVVSVDDTVAAGTAGLAGQYNFWSLDWLGFKTPVDVNPGDTIRLLKDSKGIYINYEELCRDVKKFECGAFDVDGQNAGTTLTVELRLYETKEPADTLTNTVNEETGVYKTIGVFTYTFPKIVTQP